MDGLAAARAIRELESAGHVLPELPSHHLPVSDKASNHVLPASSERLEHTAASAVVAETNADEQIDREMSKGQRRRVPIIAVTASATSEEEQACVAAGMDGFVTKPVSTAGLLAALRPYVRLKSLPPPATRK